MLSMSTIRILISLYAPPALIDSLFSYLFHTIVGKYSLNGYDSLLEWKQNKMLLSEGDKFMKIPKLQRHGRMETITKVKHIMI